MAIPVTVGVDDAMKAKLTQYLDHLEASVRQGGDFVAAQVPDVVNQMVAYNLGSAIALFVLGIALAIGAFFGARWLLKCDGRRPDIEVPLSLGTIVAAVASIGMILVNGNTILKCWLAPKYFILEQIIALVK